MWSLEFTPIDWELHDVRLFCESICIVRPQIGKFLLVLAWPPCGKYHCRYEDVCSINDVYWEAFIPNITNLKNEVSVLNGFCIESSFESEMNRAGSLPDQLSFNPSIFTDLLHPSTLFIDRQDYDGDEILCSHLYTPSKLSWCCFWNWGKLLISLGWRDCFYNIQGLCRKMRLLMMLGASDLYSVTQKR